VPKINGKILAMIIVAVGGIIISTRRKGEAPVPEPELAPTGAELGLPPSPLLPPTAGATVGEAAAPEPIPRLLPGREQQQLTRQLEQIDNRISQLQGNLKVHKERRRQILAEPKTIWRVPAIYNLRLGTVNQAIQATERRLQIQQVKKLHVEGQLQPESQTGFGG